ncbi:MAG: carboxy terminal-processing peptidase, partial [Gammaproteobacteria bacterium]|nr:carboxy terminal-processing peptidase [Gammaproteobacteria bacterium]
MNKSYKSVLLIAILLAVTPIQSQLTEDENIPAILSENPVDSHLLKLVAALSEQAHFSRKKVTNELSPFILINFLEKLDPVKMYFTRSDIRYFQRYRFKIDDALKQGNLEPIYDIFRIYRLRVQQRLGFCVNLLLTQDNNFESDGSYDFNRQVKNWFDDIEELENLWQRKTHNDLLTLILAGQSKEIAIEVLEKRYRRFIRKVNLFDEEDVISIFLNAFVHTLDPHSNYLNPTQSEEYEIQMSLSYQGIGARLNLADEQVQVVNIIPGGPAARDGRLKPMDKIIGIMDEKNKTITDLIGWDLDEVVKLIRGPKGTRVTLQIIPSDSNSDETPYLLTLQRDEVALEEQAASSLIETLEIRDKTYNIGVVTIPSFYQDYQARSKGEAKYRSTSEDVKKLVHNLLEIGIDALVIDLRGNSGGLLTEATALTGLFIDDGPVVQLKDTRNKIEIVEDPISGSVYEGPLAVIVDRYSASASEIFAGAIQDYSRGIVVGQQTFGKGTVQNLYHLDRYSRFQSKKGFGQLTLTIGKFYRVSGQGTQNKGVIPDIRLPSFIDEEVVGEDTKKNTLPWDKIMSLEYDSDLSFHQSIEKLKKNFAEKSKENLPLLFLQEDIDQITEQNKQTKLSLNYEKRKIKRDQFKKITQDRRTKRLEEMGYSNEDNFN